MKTKKIKKWHYVLKLNGRRAEKGCALIAMSGYSRFDNYYLCVPKVGFYWRSANSSRYGEYMSEYFIDGMFVGAGRMDKREKAKQLYEAGHTDEAREYILGYRLWRETSLGGAKINKYKEAARISHPICSETGANGHEMRQIIRRMILH